MLRTGRHFLAALSLLLVSFMPYIVSAGDTINDFDAAGTTFSVTQNGNAPGPVAGPTGNYYRLTEAINGQHNFIAFDRTQNPDRSQTITADFDFRLGEGSNPPADGLGFALIDVGADTGGFAWGAAETPAANQIVVGVGFHVYNGALDSRITLHNRNGEFASVNTNNLPANAFPLWRGDIDPATAAFDHCRVTVDLIAQTVTVVITPASSGTPVTVINNQSIPGLEPFKWRAAFGGRTGGLNTEIAIDNVNITSTTLPDVLAPTITAAPDVLFFNSPVSVTVTNNEVGGTTYYTTDGSAPSPTNGTAVTTTANFQVTTTTLVRATTFATGKLFLGVQRQFNEFRNPDNPSNASAAGVRGRYYRVQGFNGGPIPDFPNLAFNIQSVKPKFLHDNNANPFEPQAVRENDYSIQYSGFITIPADGIYTFRASSDDGTRVFIGDTLVVNNNNYQGFGNFVAGDIGLRAGKHAILVQFAEGGGDARMQIDWEGPGVPREEIPTSVLTTIPSAENPTIGIGGGNTFATQATVTITSTSGDPAVIPTIYYTLDGSVPSTGNFSGSFPSGGSFNITADTQVRAIAVLPTTVGFDSAVSTATFTRTDPSRLQSATATSATNVDLYFVNPIDASGNSAANFTIDQGITVQAAAVDGTNGRIVHLTVSPALTPLTLYTVTVNNVQSTAAVAVPNGSSASFKLGLNGVFLERYAGTNDTLDSLRNLPAFPNSPFEKRYLTQMSFGDLGDNYGTRMQALLVVTVAGDYQFRISGDDHTDLFLNTAGETPIGPPNTADAAICGFQGSTGPNDYNVFASQTSAVINLNPGRYYICLQHAEGAGGDHANVQWKIPNAADFENIPNQNLVAFGVLPSTTGGLLRERYNGFGGTAVNDLVNNAKFPNRPDFMDIVPTAESFTLGNDYGIRLRGTFIPAVTGDYRFYIGGDDDCRLLLSTDNNPANLQQILNKVGDPFGNRDWVGQADQRSAVISLVGGTSYYIVALMKEQGGGDGLAFTASPVETPTDADPANGSDVLPGALAGSQLIPDLSGATLEFVLQPASKSVLFGSNTTLTAGAHGLYTRFQWFKNNVAIPGATDATLTLNNVDGSTTAAYHCRVQGSNDGVNESEIISATANVQVVANITFDVATLNQTYDTTPRVVTATSTANLPFTLTYNGSSTPPVNAGSYPIVASITEPGVTGTANASLVVAAATATINVTDRTVTYDGTAKTVNFTTTPAGLNVTITNTPAIDAGVYAQTVTVNDPNASNTPGGTANLTISPAALTVTADNLSRAYGSANPAATIAYSGFVNGETAVVLDTAPTATIAATADAVANAGTTHTITPAGGVDNNYTFTYVNGTLTITKATLTATAGNASRQFGRPNPATVPIAFTGFVNGEDETVIDTVPTVTFAASASATATVGSTHAIIPVGGVDVNYTFAFVNGVLTITTVNDATVTLQATTKTFTGTAQTIDFVTSPAGLTVTLVYTQNGQVVSPVAVGTYDVTGTINDPRSSTAPAPTSSSTLSIVAPPPTLGSGLSANRNPATVGVPVTFTLPATSPIGLPLTITYDYGDGTSDTTGVHTYTIPTVVTVTATVQDGVNTVTATLSLTVIAAASPDGDADGDGVINSQDTDDDGDGLSDALETALGSDPSSAGSSPLTDPAQGANPGPLTLSKMSISLNFSKTNFDSISLSGTLAVPAGFVIANQKVALDVGGVVKSFTLDAKGKSPKGADSFKLGVKAKKGVVAAQTAKYMVKFGKSNYATTLAASSNLTSGDFKAVSRTVRVNVVFNGTYLRRDQPQLYTAKTGKTGKTK